MESYLIKVRYFDYSTKFSESPLIAGIVFQYLKDLAPRFLVYIFTLAFIISDK